MLVKKQGHLNIAENYNIYTQTRKTNKWKQYSQWNLIIQYNGTIRSQQKAVRILWKIPFMFVYKLLAL